MNGLVLSVLNFSNQLMDLIDLGRTFKCDFLKITIEPVKETESPNSAILVNLIPHRVQSA